MTEASIQWNYTTVLNIIFLILAAALCYRFTRTGGTPMLKMMGGAPDPDANIPPMPSTENWRPGVYPMNGVSGGHG